MGPFELMDLVGLDVGFAVAKSFYEQSFGEPRWRPSPLAARLVAARAARPQDRPRLVRVPGAGPPTRAAGARRRRRAGRVAGERAAAGSRTRRRPAGTSPAGDADGEVPALIVDCGATDYPPLQGGPQRSCATPRRSPRSILAARRPASTSRRRSGALVELTASASTRRRWRGRAVLRLARAARRVGRRRAGARARPDRRQLVNEACFALGEGVGSAADIDAGMVLGLNHPRGPLEWGDAIGPAACWRCSRAAEEYREERYRPAPALLRAVARGVGRSERRVAAVVTACDPGSVGRSPRCRRRRSPRPRRRPAAPATPAPPPWRCPARPRASAPTRHLDRRRPAAAPPRGAIAARFGARHIGPAATGGYVLARAQARALAAALRSARPARLRRAERAAAAARRRVAARPALGPPYAWRAGRRRPGARAAAGRRPTSPLIALVDAQLDATHPEFAGGNITHARRAARSTDLARHRDRVRGRRAANGVGILGVWPGARALNVPLPDDDDHLRRLGDGHRARRSSAGAAVINMSYGSPTLCTRRVRRAPARGRGAGSSPSPPRATSSTQGNPLEFPASLPHVLTVAAVGRRRPRVVFSNANAAVDLSAPGEASSPPSRRRSTRTATADGYDAPGRHELLGADGRRRGRLGPRRAARPHARPGRRRSCACRRATSAQPGWDTADRLRAARRRRARCDPGAAAARPARAQRRHRAGSTAARSARRPRRLRRPQADAASSRLLDALRGPGRRLPRSRSAAHRACGDASSRRSATPTLRVYDRSARARRAAQRRIGTSARSRARAPSAITLRNRGGRTRDVLRRASACQRARRAPRRGLRADGVG